MNGVQMQGPNSEEPTTRREEIGAFSYVLYLTGSMVASILLAYFLSDGWVTRFPAQNLFFFFFWSLLGIGVIWGARVLKKPLRGPAKTAGLILGFAILCLFFGDKIFR